MTSSIPGDKPGEEETKATIGAGSESISHRFQLFPLSHLNSLGFFTGFSAFVPGDPGVSTGPGPVHEGWKRAEYCTRNYITVKDLRGKEAPACRPELFCGKFRSRIGTSN